VTGPSQASWHHRCVIFSVAYQLTRCLPGGLMLLTRREVAKEAGLLVLRHENAVPRRQAGRVRYQPADRLWLAALSRLIPRTQRRAVPGVTPATLLAWHRRLTAREWDYTSRRSPGRPRTAAAIRKLVMLGVLRWLIDRQHLVTTFVTNLHGPGTPVSFLGSAVSEVIPLTAVTGNIAVAFAVLSYAGTLTVTVTADIDAFPDSEVLVAALQDELDALTYRVHA
jgi:WS/DGAT C-terminal domain